MVVAVNSNYLLCEIQLSEIFMFRIARSFQKYTLSRLSRSLSDIPASPSSSNNNDGKHFPCANRFDGEELGLSQVEGFLGEAKEKDSGSDLTITFNGISMERFSQETADILGQEVNPDDIEVKPDGLLYLPEIKYRRILNKAFGPGGWGLVPRGPHTVLDKTLSREYALFCRIYLLLTNSRRKICSSSSW